MKCAKKLFSLWLAAAVIFSCLPALSFADGNVTLSVQTAASATVRAGDTTVTADREGKATLSVPAGDLFVQITASGKEPAYLDLNVTEDSVLSCTLREANSLTLSYSEVISQSTGGFYNDASGDSRAFDGDFLSEGWQSMDKQSGDYVGVRFGSGKTVSSAAIWWEESSRAPRENTGYRIEYTANGTDWLPVGNAVYTFGTTEFSNTSYDTVTFTPVNAVGVRLCVLAFTADKYAARVRELHFYADNAPAATYTLTPVSAGTTDGRRLSAVGGQFSLSGDKLRLIAAVDALHYDCIGFTVKATAETKTFTDTFVYNTVGSFTGYDFGFPGGYLFVLTVTDLPEKVSLTARAFAEKDGVRYSGEETVISRSSAVGSMVQTYAENVRFSSSFEEGDASGLISTLEGTAKNITAAETTGGNSPMTTAVSNGPEYTFGGIAQAGLTGEKALKIRGTHSTRNEASCSNVLFTGLNLPVTKNTRLSYALYPSTQASNSYDTQYTSMYLSLDLVFTDGTRLSALGARDQNGFAVDPVSQGESRALYTNQWNYIQADVGSVAAGKTVDRILVSYRKPNSTASSTPFLAYLDDVTLSDITGEDYDHLADYVNILRGTNSTPQFSRGLATPAVALPRGFNNFTPVTDAGDNLPYYYHLTDGNDTLSSLSIEHTASYWVGDYATWQFMPSTAVKASSLTSASEIDAEHRKAAFSHENETAACYYYGVTFDEGTAASGVRAEITPTMYGAVARFTFPEGSSNRTLLFDCENGAGSLSFGNDKKSLTAWADDLYSGARRLYITATLDTPFVSQKNFGKTGAVTFADDVTTVEMTLATSFISTAQAKKNYSFDFETLDSFNKVCLAARDAWDEALGIVEPEDATFTQKVTFYSCLYRMNVYPSLYTENVGTAENPEWKYASPYTGSNTSPTQVSGALVCNTGLWDTYRTAWPWYTMASKSNTLINGLLQHYLEYGWNGQWIGVKGFQCMVGTHSDIIYADAAVKGIAFDRSAAMDSMLRNASSVRDRDNVGREENETAVFKGYVSASTPRGLSWTLDNAQNDFGLYVMAQKLGLTDEAAYYANRAKNYVNVFYPEAGFFVGRNADGSFVKTASKFKPTDFMGDYTETNGWNMAFNPVYDMGGLISLYGGDAAFEQKLDTYFSTPITNVSQGSIHEARESREVRLGQYQHANQVAHHIGYLYDFVGAPYKTQEIIRDVLSRCYVGSEIGQGYIGDEDNGEQSAWYVFSSLGFYPAAPATGQYTVGSPLFAKATLHLETGDVTITAHNNSAENIYIASCTVDGQPWNKPYLTQEQLDSGADIVFEMTDTPTSWGSSERPYSLTPYGSTASLLTDATKLSTGVNASLTDDTSETSVSFGSSATLTFTFTTAQKVQIVTLTGKNEAMNLSSYTLAGSNNGTSWTTLDTRSNLSFAWSPYTRPFLVPQAKQGSYRYYRITLRGQNIVLAETELLSNS